MSSTTAGPGPTTLHPPAARFGPRATMVAVGNEVSKGLRHAWSERLQILIEVPLFVAMSLLFSLLLGQGEQVAATGHLASHLDPHQTGWMFLGFAAFAFTYLQVVKVFWRLLGEIQSGTLEQTYLSPLPAWTHVALGRVAATMVETAFVVAVMYAVTRAFVDLSFAWQPAVLIAIAFLIVGSVGFSLIVAGLTLVLKRMQLINDLVLGLMMLISGAILPLAAMPSWVSEVAGPLFLTQAVAGLRTTMLDGHPLPTWGMGGLVGLTVTSTAWLVIGAAVFAIGERIARRQGSLARY
jgi:ABC-2 type transport system permease protein